jgi:hypothetical protein
VKFFFSTVLLSLLYFLWRCQFGVDLTDEAFYILPSWKLMALGDRPFVDEVYYATRQIDLLNRWLLSWWIPYSVYWIRVSVTWAFAGSLALFCWLAIGKKIPLFAALVYLSYLFCDEQNLFSWSYNWWIKILLLLQGSLFLLAREGRLRRRALFLSGLLGGLAVTAHNLLLPVFLGTLFLVFIADKTSKVPRLSGALPYGLGLVLGILPISVYIFLHKEEWIFALGRMLTDSRDYGPVHPIQKCLGIIRWLHGTEEFWIFLLIAIASVWERARRFLFIILLITLGAYLFRRATGFEGSFPRIFGAVSFASLLVFSPFLIRERRDDFWIPIWSAFGAALTMGVASVNGTGSLHFAWGAPWVLGFALVSEKSSKNALLMGFAAILALYGGYQGFRHNLSSSYMDVGPAQTEVTLQIPPLKGLRTTKRKAFLIERISELVKDRDFAITYPFLPGTLFFGDVRHSLDTTITHSISSRELHAKYLKHISSGRPPEIAVIALTSPWSWGMGKGMGRIENVFAADDGIWAYVNCSKTKLLLEEPEVVVWELDPKKSKICLNGALSSSKDSKIQ